MYGSTPHSRVSRTPSTATYARPNSSRQSSHHMPATPMRTTPIYTRSVHTESARSRSTVRTVPTSTSRFSRNVSVGAPLPSPLPPPPPPALLPTPSIPSALHCSRVSIVARVRPVNRVDQVLAGGAGAVCCSRVHAIPSARTVVLLPPIDTFAGSNYAHIADSLLNEAHELATQQDLIEVDAEAGESRQERQEANTRELANLPGARSFQFNAVFNSTASQAEVFRASISPAVDDVLGGINAVVMCYGQTGAGKTYTIFGPDIDVARVTAEDASLLGVLPRAMHDLFERLELRADAFDFIVQVQYMQLYCDAWIDLLADAEDSKAAGFVRSARPAFVAKARAGSSTYVPPAGTGHHALGLTVGSPQAVSYHTATNVREVLMLLHTGAMRKATACTRLNDNSSRGHTIFHVHVTRKMKGAAHFDTMHRNTNGQDVILHSTLTFLDLAGSERVAASGALGNVTRLAEAKFINTSLHALGRVLTCLAKAAISQDHYSKELQYHSWIKGSAAEEAKPKPAQHIPWRSSKLTQFLQGCICPNRPQEGSITLVLCASPTDAQCNETLSTLVFGARTHAVAEALAGASDVAQLLLRDSTYRAHIGRPEESNDHQAAQTDATQDETYSAQWIDPPAGGASWQGVSASTTPSKSLTTREVDLVIDRQRTQIGALTQQYENLAAAHAQLIEKYQSMSHAHAPMPQAPPAFIGTNVQFTATPAMSRMSNADNVTLEALSAMPIDFAFLSPPTTRLHRAEVELQPVPDRSPLLDVAYRSEELRSAIRSARPSVLSRQPPVTGAPPLAAQRDTPAVDRIQDAISRAKLVMAKLASHQTVTPKSTNTTGTKRPSFALARELFNSQMDVAKPSELHAANASGSQSLYSAPSANQTHEARNTEIRSSLVAAHLPVHEVKPEPPTLSSSSLQGHSMRDIPTHDAHSDRHPDIADAVDDDVFVSALSRTQNALNSALEAIRDAYGGEVPTGTGQLPPISALRMKDVMISPQEISRAAVEHRTPQ